MTKIKITFLGTATSQGVPVIACKCKVCTSVNPKDKRLRSSVMLEIGKKVLVIDSGPDFRQQMLREDVSRLDGLIFTHEHKDHIAGMDDIRGFNFVQKKAIDVYATTRVQEALKREFHYIFSGDNYPGIPEINMHTIDNTPFKVGDIAIQPIEVMHYRLPVLGFRIGNFTYITDANHISEAEKQKIIGSEVIVLNALRKRHHISHFTFKQAIALLKELKPKVAYLTHISHQLGLHDEIEKELPDFIRCGYDGLKVEIM